MNFTNMDPANELLLILAIVAALAERIMTFCEYLARRRNERSMQNYPVQSTALADRSDLRSGADSEVRSTGVLVIGSTDAYKSASRASRQIISRRLEKLEIVGRLNEGQPGNTGWSAEE